MTPPEEINRWHDDGGPANDEAEDESDDQDWDGASDCPFCEGDGCDGCDYTGEY